MYTINLFTLHHALSTDILHLNCHRIRRWGYHFDYGNTILLWSIFSHLATLLFDKYTQHDWKHRRSPMTFVPFRHCFYMPNARIRANSCMCSSHMFVNWYLRFDNIASGYMSKANKTMKNFHKLNYFNSDNRRTIVAVTKYL